jgi:HAD superfamily hydrolase (TIGR01549 family)
VLEVKGLRAVVFDVDGTLYLQPPLRRAMALRLLRAHALRPLKGLRTLRALQAYRHAQEHLREVTGDVALAQLDQAAARSGLSKEQIGADVARWMEQEPLPLLVRYLRPGTKELIAACRKAGLKLGVLSDYPAEAKLAALGLGGLFDAVLFAQSPEIGVFKPNPRGLLAAVKTLGVTPAETLYVGDRPEVDSAAAEAAGIRCAIVTSHPTNSQLFAEVPGFHQLERMLFGS